MTAILNAKIKRRESFRPFAPSILEEPVPEWFEEDDAVPFMIQVFQIRKEKRQLIARRGCVVIASNAVAQAPCLNSRAGGRDPSSQVQYVPGKLRSLRYRFTFFSNETTGTIVEHHYAVSNDR